MELQRDVVQESFWEAMLFLSCDCQTQAPHCLCRLKSKEASNRGHSDSQHLLSLSVIVSCTLAQKLRQFKGLKSGSSLSSGQLRFLVIVHSHLDMVAEQVRQSSGADSWLVTSLMTYQR